MFTGGFTVDESLFTDGSSKMIKYSRELIEWQKDVDERVEFAISEGKAMGLIVNGDSVICVQGNRPGSGYTSALRILIVE